MPDDTLEKYRPNEYRRPEKEEDSETDDNEIQQPYMPYQPTDRSYKPQRKANRSEIPQMEQAPPVNDPYFFQSRPVKSKRPDDRDDRRRNTSNPRGSRSNSLIGRGSHMAPEVSPQRRRRQPSPNKLDSIQDFLNSKPQPSAAKRPNLAAHTSPNIGRDMGRQQPDMGYDKYPRVKSGIRGGDPRDMRGDPRDMRGDPRDMRGDPRDMRGDPRDMRGDPRDMRGDPRDMRGDPRDMRGDPRDMRGDPRDMRDPRDSRDPRYDEFGASPGRGGRGGRGGGFRSPDSRYSDNSGYNGNRGGMTNAHGGYNL